MSEKKEYVLVVNWHEYGGDRSIPRSDIYKMTGDESISEAYAKVESVMNNRNSSFTITLSQLITLED